MVCRAVGKALVTKELPTLNVWSSFKINFFN
jgi:hypothetical protein